MQGLPNPTRLETTSRDHRSVEETCAEENRNDGSTGHVESALLWAVT